MPTMLRSISVKTAALLLLLSISACSLFKGSTPTSRTPTSSSMQLRRNIVGYAQKFVGAPYQYAGTSPKTGFDCSGFTSFVLKEFRIPVSPASARQATEGIKVPLETVLPGDLVFFSQDGNRISHVAMVVERTKTGIVCVHSTTSRGVITENITTSTYWKPRIQYARDVIGPTGR